MVPVPRRWTVILRDRADTARPIRPEDCHGLLNRWWPHPPEEHALAKRWAMNGWPAPLGDRLYHWTLTWLDDEVPPPSDPEEAVGRVQRIGDHLLEPLSVTRTFDRRYGELLAGPRGPLPVRSAELRSRTPVVTATRDSSGERIPHVWPGPRRIFGAVHRSGGGIVGGSGAMGAVARFAPPALAGTWLESAFEGLDLVRRLPVPGEEIRLAEHHQAEGRTVLGWQGGLRLELTGGDRRHAEAFTALLELVELTGVGKYTAQGFGSVLVDTVTPGAPSSAVVAQRARRAPQRPPSRPGPGPLETRAAVAGLEEFGGLLFD
ncbi:CRISPR system precrRNA processing endoribonuclease RAMP protein Cas6 [Nocardiopsis changdeensis]|uniref:CRISPR system precrRNA processing endoribonuclease RAMP protein Cas6 n=1 Tax=Nocardiopsis changdeensis TaxID=2831969 RepID=A0ABX8BW89_9ACTN|nr:MULTISPECIES: CRISPR system precrRNA processing endoribonuclease RAMP protein Cas6 [Nocardiopsis]QUX24608.1 CRISPR system precrRNA processing endoribonuclease RAMP protein Cas6 [Nocardiopsis changdeensis]QYX34996.1 CRISPR system precrRNA processing endoribonuclease RAMP protein Cas6 [Nocardiopsis sp. MT53]